MGIARFNNGVFRLVVSARHDADATRLNEWKASFQRASQLLFDATLGQHRFGEILVANRSMGSAEADCWLMEDPGASASSHGFAQPGEHSTLMGDERFRPFIILHEFSHYAYDVFDEYAGDAGAAECVGGTTANACIMESGASAGDRFGASGNGGALVEGRVKHYCVAANHDPDGDTRQDNRRQHSCWECMVGRFPDLVMPTAPPPTASAGNVPNIVWTLLAPEQRFVLVIDRSGSMNGSKLREAQNGSHFWVDSAAISDVLGAVSFASSASVDRSLQTLADDADRAAYHTVIDAWTAAAQTAIGTALRTALDEILGLGQRAATQVVILLTDGIQNRGEALASVIPDLVDAGVRVYAIAVGPAIDDAALVALASQTGGRFIRIDPALSEADQSAAVRTALEELSVEVRDSGGIVTSSEYSSEPGQARRTSVEIEAGSQLATFLVSRRAPKDVLTLRVTDPKGKVYSSEAPAAGMRLIAGDFPYVAIQVPKPKAGMWKVEVRSASANSRTAKYHLLVASQNKNLGTACYPAAAVYRAGEKVQIHVRAFTPLPVTGLKIAGVMSGPKKAKRSVTFRDDGRGADAAPNDGVYTAQFAAPKAPGTYRVRVSISGARDRMRLAEADEPDDRSRRRGRDVLPSLSRMLETSFVVTKK